MIDNAGQRVGMSADVERSECNVLVDHGCKLNLGDFGMLASVCRMYAERSGVVCSMMRRPGLADQLIDGEQVHDGGESMRRNASSRPAVSGLPGYSLVPRRFRKSIEGRHANRNLLKNGAETFVMDASGAPLSNFCSQFDALHLVGGGYLNDGFMVGTAQKCALIHAFADAGKPVIMTGQQLGPFRGRKLRNSCINALRRVDFLGVREPLQSIAFCKEAGVAADALLMGDDVFGLPYWSRRKDHGLLDKLGLAPGSYIAVNFRLSSYSREHDDSFVRYAELIRLLSKETGCDLVYVPITLASGDSDLITAQRLLPLLGNTRMHIPQERDCSLENVISLVGNAVCSVGASYHFSTFSLLQGVPAFATVAGGYYMQKGRGLAELWGVSDLCQDLTVESSACVRKRVRSAMECSSRRDFLLERSSELISRWRIAFSRAADFATLRMRCP